MFAPMPQLLLCANLLPFFGETAGRPHTHTHTPQGNGKEKEKEKGESKIKSHEINKQGRSV